MIAISGSKNWIKQIRSFSCLCIVSLSVACSSPSTQINEPPMEKKYLHQLVDYNHWATEQIVTWLLTLDEAIMHQVTPSSFPTLHETVVHNWGAEAGWTSLLKTNTWMRPFEGEEFLSNTKETLTNWLNASAVLKEFVSSPAFENIQLETEDYTPSEVVIHVVNHSTHHRGQIITMARALGVENPPRTDFIYYLKK